MYKVIVYILIWMARDGILTKGQQGGGKFNVSLSISGGGLSATVCINGSVTIDCRHSETMVHPVWHTNRIRYILNNRMERFNKISHSARLHSLRIGPVPNDRGWNVSTYICQYWRGVTVYQSNKVTLFIKECSPSSTSTVVATMSSDLIKTDAIDIQDISTNGCRPNSTPTVVATMSSNLIKTVAPGIQDVSTNVYRTATPLTDGNTSSHTTSSRTTANSQTVLLVTAPVTGVVGTIATVTMVILCTSCFVRVHKKKTKASDKDVEQELNTMENISMTSNPAYLELQMITLNS